MNLKIEALENITSPAANYFVHRNIDVKQFEPTPFGMFDFSSVGILIAILGVLFIALIGWRLIPKESYKKPSKGFLFSIDEYITEIRIPKECKFIGLKIGVIEKFTEDRLSIFGYIMNFCYTNNFPFGGLSKSDVLFYKSSLSKMASVKTNKSKNRTSLLKTNFS